MTRFMSRGIPRRYSWAAIIGCGCGCPAMFTAVYAEIQTGGPLPYVDLLHHGRVVVVGPVGGYVSLN